MNLNINITPAVSAACMSGLGYVLGKYGNINPKQAAFIFFISETVRQVFLFLNDSFNLFSKEQAWVISAPVSCMTGMAFLHARGLIPAEKLTAFFICSMLASLCLTAALGHFRARLSCKIG